MSSCHSKFPGGHECGLNKVCLTKWKRLFEKFFTLLLLDKQQDFVSVHHWSKLFIYLFSFLAFDLIESHQLAISPATPTRI